MADYDFETWDVFTSTRFAGNPLAVVFGADTLTDEEMLTITREFNLSETVFIRTPSDLTNDARLRIFTPGYEMPFAGHPTVGAALAVAARRAREGHRSPGHLSLELNAGIFPVNLSTVDGTAFAAFTNPNLPQEAVQDSAAPDAALIEAAFHLPSGAIDRGPHKPRRVGAGVDYVFARASLAHVQAARFNMTGFEALGVDGIVGVVLYSEGGVGPGASFHTRMFAPVAGIIEDPATGSAAAALPGQIAASQSIADGTHHWLVEQGFEMGRPSQIHLTVEVQGGAVRSVRVGGAGVQVSRGKLTV